MVTTVLITLMILALLEIVLLNGARLFFMIASAVQQAQDEYIKAWCALKIMSKVYGFGDPDGFVFNMSVGYDLDGIKVEQRDGQSYARLDR